MTVAHLDTRLAVTMAGTHETFARRELRLRGEIPSGMSPVDRENRLRAAAAAAEAQDAGLSKSFLTGFMTGVQQRALRVFFAEHVYTWAIESVEFITNTSHYCPAELAFNAEMVPVVEVRTGEQPPREQKPFAGYTATNGRITTECTGVLNVANTVRCWSLLFSQAGCFLANALAQHVARTHCRAGSEHAEDGVFRGHRVQ